MSARQGTTKGGRASPARELAFRVLRGVDARRGEPAALLRAPGSEALSQVDRNLANEIVYGVLRFRGLLDFVLSHHSTRPLASIDAPLLLALRIGLYQVRFSSRIPHRAAVDESVKLARHHAGSRGAGFVNAVLRNTLRHPESPRLPRREDDDAGRYLSITLSHPDWLVRRYLDRLGFDAAEARCRRQNEVPPLFVRASRRLDPDAVRQRLGAEGVLTEPFPIVPRCLRVASGDPKTTTLYREGQLYVQDAASQLVPLLLDLVGRETVLDVCAAPGGKASAIAEIVTAGRVLALDRRHRRTKGVRRLAEQLRLTNLLPVTADGLKLPTARPFERILLDVPCSSLGTLRRNPDIKWRVEAKDLVSLQEIQLELLRRSAAALARGGRLLYVTCSTEPEENEGVIERFLEESSRFEPLPVGDLLPAPARHLATEAGWLETRPERDDMDGFFAALLTSREQGA